jgi:hypothetical protein
MSAGHADAEREWAYDRESNIGGRGRQGGRTSHEDLKSETRSSQFETSSKSEGSKSETGTHPY